MGDLPMINNLIKPPPAKKAVVKQSLTAQAAPSEASRCARLFVDTMGDAQRTRFKQMLQSGAKCGLGYAQSYGVPVDEFVTEVEKII